VSFVPETDDATPVVAYRPTVKHVAEEIPARVLDAGGNRPGTFTSATTPTGDQVERIIDKSLGEVAMTLGYVVPASCLLGAQRLVALHAAASIEMGYWPEQSGSGTATLLARLDARYDKLLPMVERCIAMSGAGGPDTDIATADEGTKPQWGFPVGAEVAEGAERSLLSYPDPRKLW